MICKESLAILNIALVSIKKVPSPTVIENEVGGHALAAITSTNFHAPAIDWWNEREDVKKNSVFFQL